MTRRRTSYGSHGVESSNNYLVSSPTTSSRNKGNNSTRNRLVPQSDASSVERWLTAPTIPIKPNGRYVPSSYKAKTASSKAQQQPAVSIASVHTHSLSINQHGTSTTRGQRLLHDRMATTCSDSFAPKSPTKQSEQPNSKHRSRNFEKEQQSVSRIVKQRDGKRFTFDDDDQEIHTVVTDDSLKTIEEEENHEVSNHRHSSRPGMTSPGVNLHRNRHQTTNVPPPPPAPRPNRPHRPTNATPVSVSGPLASHQDDRSSRKKKASVNISFVKRHAGTTESKEKGQLPLPTTMNTNPSGSMKNDQQRAQRSSLGSEGFHQRQQQKQSSLQSDSASVSSSVTKPQNCGGGNDIDQHLLPHYQRTGISACQGKSKSSSSASQTDALDKINPITRQNVSREVASQPSRPFKYLSIRDLVSLGSEGLPQDGKRQRNLFFSASRMNQRDIEEKKGVSKRTNTNAISPNSCSITAMTSGTVMTTPTDDSQDEISQLTFPERSEMATPQTNGIVSNAETEKVQNRAKHDGVQSMKVCVAPKRISLRTRQDSDEERENAEDLARETSKKTLLGKEPSVTVAASTAYRKEVVPKASHDIGSAMQVLLRKTNRIKLHVYDLVENDTQLDLYGCYFPLGQCFNALNSSLHSLGTGAYHVGIEINGVEYAYGSNSTTGLTGVFTCMPKHSPGYQYRQSIDFGNRLTTRNQYSGDGSKRKLQTPVPVDGREVVREMASEYMGTDYDLLRKNCCTFAHDACTRLGVRENEIPTWFHNLAAAGAVTQDAAHSTLAPINNAFNCDPDKVNDPADHSETGEIALKSHMLMH